MCIPKGARNKAAAELYINFLLDTEVAVANAEYICYASPNTKVVENGNTERI
jgi:spermidine/putrescine transport system substrate-binding protein